MKRVTLLLAVVCASFAFLPSSVAMANIPTIDVPVYKATVARHHYLNFYWDFYHSSGVVSDIVQIVVHTKIKIVNSSGVVKRSWTRDVLSDRERVEHAMNRIRFECAWRRGKYRIKLWGVDADGDRSNPYPRVVSLTIK